jgi:hypothetical protein
LLVGAVFRKVRTRADGVLCTDAQIHDTVVYMSDEPVLHYVHQRVQRGAVLLDERFPGWVDDVNLSTLDMHSLDDCVLGQVAHARLDVNEVSTGWGAGMEYLFKSTDSYVSEAYGFDGVQEYGALGAAWRRLIEERRAATS